MTTAVTSQPNLALEALKNSHDVSYLDQVKSACDWNGSIGYNPLKLLQKLVVVVVGVALYPIQQANRWINASSFERKVREFVELKKAALTAEASPEAKKADEVATENIKQLNAAVDAAASSLYGRVVNVAKTGDTQFKADLDVAARQLILKAVENEPKDATDGLKAEDCIVAADFFAGYVKTAELPKAEIITETVKPSAPAAEPVAAPASRALDVLGRPLYPQDGEVVVSAYGDTVKYRADWNAWQIIGWAPQREYV